MTADKKIAHRRLEMMAVQNSGACMFVLVSGNLSGSQMAEIFAQAVPSMKSFFAALVTLASAIKTSRAINKFKSN